MTLKPVSLRAIIRPWLDGFILGLLVGGGIMGAIVFRGLAGYWP